MTMGGDNWPAGVVNLIKARKSWAQTTRILGREGEDPRISGMFFKAVVQSVLIFGSYMWVLNPRMERDLGSFSTGLHSGSPGGSQGCGVTIVISR